MSKRGLGVAGLVAVIVGVAVWWMSSRTSASAGGTSDAVVDRGRAEAEARSGRTPTADARPTASPHAVGGVVVEPGSTPPLDAPFSFEEGVLEIHVTAAGSKVAGAAVRVYFQNAFDGSTGTVDWRYAGEGSTNAEGRLEVAARPGAYLIAARAGGFAPGHSAVVKPVGELRTRATVALTTAHTLEGRTVARGSREAVPHAELVLTPTGVSVESFAGRRSAPAEEMVLASTNARGEFRVEGLSEGSWHLEARAPTYAAARVRNVRVPAVRPLIIELSSSAFLSGYVVRSSGEPAPGAEVIIVGTEQQTAFAGDRGDFSVEVSSGSYRLSARSGGETGALAEPISVAPGATRDGLRITLESSAAIEGMVVEKDTGNPIAGARLSLSPNGAEGDSGRAVSGANGRFRIGGIAAGAYDLEARASGYSTEVAFGLAVAQGQTFTTEFRLTGTGAVEGTVTDAAKRPLAGIRVRVGHRWWEQDAEARDATTGPDGSFRVEGVQIGTRLVTASRGGDAVGASKTVEVAPGETARVDLVLAASGTVTGRVLRPEGTPVEFPTLVSVTPADQTRFGPHERARIEVGVDGSFRAELPAGDWFLAPVPSSTPNGPYGPRKRVTIEEGRTVTVDLTLPRDDPNALAGVVLEPDGGPSARAIVRLRVDGEPRGGTMTGMDGTFRLSVPPSGPQGPGRLSLHANNGGRTAELDKVAPGSQQLSLRLHPGATLRGRVRTAAGGEVTGFSAWWELVSDAPQLGMMRGDELQFTGDGFVLRDVAPGRVRIVATASDGRRGSSDVTVASGQDSTQDVTLEAGVRVRARAVDASTGEPLQDIAAAVDDGAPSYRSASSTDGVILLEVAPGAHTLRFRGAWRQPTTRSVTVAPSKPVDLGDVAMSFAPAEPGTIGARFVDVGSTTQLAWVNPGGPAASAGLRDGDAVLAIDGASVTSAADATARSRGAPGSTVMVRISRAGAEDMDRPVVRAK